MSVPRKRMGRGLRLFTQGYALAAWCTGLALAALVWWLRPVGEFGPGLHPAEPAVRLVHGVLAVPALFGLGWLTARHAGVAMASARPRAQGPVLLGALLLLAGSGFAMYHLTGDAARLYTGIAHAALGALALVPALVHWLAPRR